jgi:hypothetical protein
MTNDAIAETIALALRAHGLVVDLPPTTPVTAIWVTSNFDDWAVQLVLHRLEHTP